jgi:hypothetical protein
MNYDELVACMQNAITAFDMHPLKDPEAVNDRLAFNPGNFDPEIRDTVVCLGCTYSIEEVGTPEVEEIVEVETETPEDTKKAKK